MNPMSSAEALNQNLLKSVLKVLRHFFGMTTQTIISRLEKETGVSISDLCRRPALLSDSLYRLLGEASKTVEKRVLNDLSETLNIELPAGNLQSFAEKISAIETVFKEEFLSNEISR
jgi:hypothetical protein